MTREAIINKVKVKIEELTEFDSSDLGIVDLIGNILDESANKARLITPYYLITPTDFSSETQVEDNPDTGAGYIELPSDFLKLHTLKLQEWKRPVNIAISDSNPMYSLQRSTNTRGGQAKPIAVVVYRQSVPGKVIEYYSVQSSHTIEQALYIQKLSAAENENSNMIEIMTWQAAADVLDIMGDNEQAKMAQSKMNELIQTQIL